MSDHKARALRHADNIRAYQAIRKECSEARDACVAGIEASRLAVVKMRASTWTTCAESRACLADAERTAHKVGQGSRRRSA